MNRCYQLFNVCDCVIASTVAYVGRIIEFTDASSELLVRVLSRHRL